MPLFCVIEGVDGTGKSHLANALAEHLVETGRQDVTVILKDGGRPDGQSWAEKRLRAMHKLTWSYDTCEPVWEYSRDYWLFTLLAWYKLFHEILVAPNIAAGQVVVTDGWYFKHQSRFRLSNDDGFIRLANETLRALPQPDMVVCLEAPVVEVATRKQGASKPSEHGAFDNRKDSVDRGSFVDYQQRTQDGLLTVLHEHPATVHVVSHLLSPPDVIELIDRRLARRPG